MTKRLESKYKIDRRMGENIWGRSKSPVNRREYGPGQHQVDDDDLEQRGERFMRNGERGQQVGHDKWALGGSFSPTSQSRDCQRGPA